MDGVAGDASSWRRLKLACRSCPARFGMNLIRGSVRKPHVAAVCRTHRSPYIRGRFRLGLAVGVRSLTRPACSMCPSAFVSAAASIGSELRSSVLEGKVLLRLWEAVGGVFDSGGEINVGVAMSSWACAFVAAAAAEPRRTIVLNALCYDVCDCAGQWFVSKTTVMS